MHELSILQREHFDQLLVALKNRGYQVIGPTVRDGAIVYGELDSTGDLPVGWTDEQEGGTYRLKKRDRRCPVRLHGRSAFLEAVPASAGGASVAGRPVGQEDSD